MHHLRAAITAAALVAGLAASTAVAASAADPIGPTGTGPSTSVTGWYRYADQTGYVGPWTWAPPADDVTFTLSPSARVEVTGNGGSCVVPDTREVRRSDDDHQAVCLMAPEVTEEWAR